jgi:hypothetical protein
MTKLLRVLILVVPFACTNEPDAGTSAVSGGAGGKGGAGVAGSRNESGSGGKAGGDAIGGTAGSGAGSGRSGSDPGGEGGESGSGTTGGTSGQNGSAGKGGTGGGGQGGTAGSQDSEAGEGGAGMSGSSGTGGTGGSVEGRPCDVYFDQLHLLPEIEGAINSAAAGDTICLNGSWDGSLAIQNAAATATERIVICASDYGDVCSWGWWRLNGLGGGISFSPQSDGFVLANFDVFCSADCEEAVGVDLGGAGHIRLASGSTSFFKHGVQCDTAATQTAPCDDIEMLEVDVSSNDVGIYGSLRNSTLHVQTSANLSHHVYLTSNASDAPNENIVIEDSHFSRSFGEPDRSGIRLSGQNRNIVIQGNDIRGMNLIECVPDNSNLDEYCDGLEIHNNWLESVGPSFLNLESAQHVRVYNNEFYRVGLQYLAVRNGEAPASDAWFFNNTLISISYGGTAFTLEGTGHRVFNNLFYYESGAGGADLITGGDAACDTLGTGGEDFEHNFVYSTDASPVLPTCGSNNSMTLDVLPGFVSYVSTNYHIVSASAAAGFGTADGAPTVDIEGVARPNPPSAGAYDVN